MKLPLPILASLPLLFVLPCSAAFEPWTNKEGVTVSMDLVSVSGEGDAIAGKFRMTNGRTTTVKGSNLDEASLEKLKAAQAAQAAKQSGAGPASVFDKLFAKKLLKVEGDKLVAATPPKPQKYYLFYYTAKWCGPCQAFTPGFVDFYNKLKPANTNFEVVVVSWDHSDKDLEAYAVQKKMPWFVLDLGEAERFQEKQEHQVDGIPAIVITDLKGKVVAQTRDLDEIEKLVK
ncbi:MAG: thioredoxin domain-containing protein [Akkermansiaceae bacterium]|jgi:nucleoredoxin|nr:thioredoxin domain-containing protein [Akkermansiaceae bacterium]